MITKRSAALLLASSAGLSACIAPQPNGVARGPDPSSETPAPDAGINETPCRRLFGEMAPRDAGTSSHRSGDIGYVKIFFSNRFGSGFRTTREKVVLDGTVERDEVDVPKLTGPSEMMIFDDILPPGEHIVDWTVDMAGNPMGPMRGYLFELRSSHKFDVDSGRTIEVHGMAYEKRTQRPEERPAFCYGEIWRDGSGSDTGEAPPFDAGVALDTGPTNRE